MPHFFEGEIRTLSILDFHSVSVEKTDGGEQKREMG